tara:strand:+ start:817 stop:1407 length:591 start_codon:yes stop_codon:yes gene_type:complete
MKEDLNIVKLSKNECGELLNKYHYLSQAGGSKGFKSGENYGLTLHGETVGVCIYTGFPVPELVKGAFGLGRDDQKGFFELSRLVLEPNFQQSEHNAASWFVSRTIRLLRKERSVRAILSYADDDHHRGTVYRAANFAYYGKTAPRKDFFILQDDGSHVKHSRGKTKGLDGEWRKRSQKHRFMIICDKKLKCKWVKS